jgi:hypothetical protein
LEEEKASRLNMNFRNTTETLNYGRYALGAMMQPYCISIAFFGEEPVLGRDCVFTLAKPQ